MRLCETVTSALRYCVLSDLQHRPFLDLLPGARFYGEKVSYMYLVLPLLHNSHIGFGGSICAASFGFSN